jgi:hypothetical protein
MSRQDRQGVRTPADLERKYKLAEIKKSLELKDTTVTRINKIMEDFVNTIVGTLDNFEGLEDGQIMTYFYKGVPSMETVPSTEWTDGALNHLNDLYYDRDTGKAYTLATVDEVATWVEVLDKNKVNVLALANATVDAKDNKRRIYLEQPLPPYDNGDLWLKDGVIYVCQISKPETESYEEHDFIISSSYGGDTLAVKIGKSLEVLRGTVLKVLQDASEMNITIESLDDNTRSEIEFLKNSLSTLIVGRDGQSVMEQDENGIRFSITSILESISDNAEQLDALNDGVKGVTDKVEGVDTIVKQLEEKTTYVNIGTYDGKPSIELGAQKSDFKVIITNEEILFMEGSSTPAYISNETLYITKATVEEMFSVGNMSIVKRANGHISFMPKGVI